jgi:hypothetical protein
LRFTDKEYNSKPLVSIVLVMFLFGFNNKNYKKCNCRGSGNKNIKEIPIQGNCKREDARNAMLD